MKLLAALGFCFFGLIAAEYAWIPGKEYAFKYEGSLLNGIPDLAPQHSGLIIKCEVLVQAKDERTLLVKPTNITFGKVNNVIGWWISELPVTSIPIKYKTILETPIVVKFNQSMVETILVSEHEEEWSVNFKKGIMSLLQVNIGEMESVKPHQMNIVPKEIKGDEVFFHKEMETTVMGDCETVYEVARLPDYMLKEHPHLTPVPDICKDGSVYEVTKTVNFDNCRRRPIFYFFSLAKTNCMPEYSRCEAHESLMHVSTYTLCAARSNFIIQRVYSEGTLLLNLNGYEAEKARAMSNITITLEKMGRISTPITEPSNPITITSLMYDFDLHRHSNVRTDVFSDQTTDDKDQHSHTHEPTSQFLVSDLTRAPLHPITRSNMAHDIMTVIQPVMVKDDIRSLLKGIAEDFELVDDFVNKHVPQNIMKVRDALQWLDLDSMRDMFTEFAEIEASSKSVKKQTIRSIFLDALSMAGSNPSVMLIKELILSQKIKGERATQMISEFPKYIETPSIDLMNELYDLMASEVVTADRQMKVTSVLAFTSLLNHACIDPSESRSRYFTKFCNSDATVITNKFIPFLDYALRHAEDNHMRVVYLLALGHLAHDAIIPVLKPFIESHMIDSPYVRKEAIHSLQLIGQRKPHMIIPILATIFDNPAEQYEIRIEAFTMMVLCNAPVHYWQKAAVRTWFETSVQLASWIHSTFSSLAEVKDPMLMELANKARTVLPLVKPMRPGIPFSHLYFVSDFVDRLKLGYVQRLSWHSTRDSIFPTVLQYHLDYNLGSFIMNPLEIVANFYGIDNILEQIWDMFKTEDDFHPNSRFRVLSVKLERIQHFLNILKRPDIPVESSLYIKFCHDIERFFSFNKKSVPNLIKEMMKFLPFAQEGFPFNIQKAASLGRNFLSVPTPMGIPVDIMIENFGVVSLRGDVRLETTPKITETDGKISVPKVSVLDLNIKPVFDWKVHAKMGITLPFTGKYYAAGVDKHMCVSLPGKVSVELNMEKNKMKMTLKPNEDIQKLDLVHYHIKPFTSVTNYLTFLPSTREVQIRTIIPLSEPTVTPYEFSFGERFTGLKFEYKHMTRSRHVDFSSLMETFGTRTLFHSSIFFWTTPTYHETEVSILFDREHSETKEIEIQISMGMTSKSDTIPSFTDRSDMTFHSDVVDVNKDSLYTMLSKADVDDVMSVDAMVKLVGVHNYQYVASITYGSDQSYIKPKVSIHVNSKAITDKNIPSFAVCVEGDVMYPDLPHLDLQTLHTDDITSFMNWKILVGQTCSSGGKITINGEMHRTAEIMDHITASTESRLCEKEQATGVKAGPQCTTIMRRSTMLNKLDFKIKYNEMPKYIRVMAHRLENFLKAFFYTHMTDDIDAQNANHEIHIVSEIHADKTTMDLSIQKPQNDLMFSNIRLTPLVQHFLPLSAKQSIMEKTWNTLFGDQHSYTCSMEKDHIFTFDNMTYTYALNDCEHLILKDCSKDSKLAVLAKEVSGKKVVKILLESNEIEVTAADSYISSDRMNVILNEEKVEIPEKKKFQIKDYKDDVVAEISKTKDGLIRIYDFINKIEIFCGVNRIYIHVFNQSLRNKLCGLCGDFNTEKVADLKSPEMCIMKHPELFGYSYMLQDETCSGMPMNKNSALEMERKECTKHEVIKSKLDGVIREEPMSCTTFRHLVFDREQEICFSKVPLPKCTSPCRPTTMKNKLIQFYCMEHGSESEGFEMKAKHGVIEELRKRQVNFVTTFGMPESCKHI